MRFSLLDRSRTRAGRPEQQALPDSVERAVAAERLGYHRFWVAEHHTVPGIASGAPAVLLAAIGQRTDRIRLGSGGVMLPNHRPLVVAEQFLMLEALTPGRVDLGLGRSLGFTAPVREALGRVEASTEQFATEVRELRALLEGTAPLTARPVAPEPPPMFLLATGAGLDLAARLGLGVVLGGSVLHAADVAERVAAYRRAFRPHRGSAPHVTLSMDLLVADTDAEARELALSEVWAMVRSRETGAFPALEDPARLRERDLTARERDRVEKGLASAWAGTPATLRPRVERVLEATGADELLAAGATFDRSALADSDARVMELLG
ncbi:MsnO8 family LLM class oxidoreductase [Brachybacterium saurashtrense]|uniref:MsnO8 family LLM class oxidoreductase n=1 Tax=Brachybacterium saurashtrense TaxID=556288 RepID=A0A345YKB1_9MICO|nr:MsnO8 family LLM class oxidoreductase [Brachybacterium saurashtrense]AXK44363.1 MsnO8 family LLM class oxidoreductase [Brachybacterium saurashtrense]RRR21305.1 MsnO8 family LLM class oxidoreductase [Brachybacterium saurashtrense]RRR22974.1 MsnO8 family LLM class oxidoreductase [Brachybacterium saurashtrense]